MYYYPVFYPNAYPTWGYHPYYDARQYGQPVYPYVPVVEQTEVERQQHGQQQWPQHGQQHGPQHGNQFQTNRPEVLNIDQATKRNRDFRRVIWTGRHLQVVLMNIRRRQDIGLEVHPRTDQFIKVVEGRALVQMGRDSNNLTFRRTARENDAIMIPAGMWHNIRNTGDGPLRVYTIYAPPEHPHGFSGNRVEEEEE